ncbi:MAG: hypothetical protein HFJ32_00655 [Clostridia bacterium]|nr:hypothetical protein [Clostridia bacterium]
MEQDYYKVKKAQNISLIVIIVVFIIGAIGCFCSGTEEVGVGLIIGGAIVVAAQSWMNYLFLLKIKGPMIIIEQNKEIIEMLSKIVQK